MQKVTDGVTKIYIALFLRGNQFAQNTQLSIEPFENNEKTQTESIQSFMTGEIRGLFEKNASKFDTKSSHKALEDSEVRDAWWGDSTTLSIAKSSLGTSGSFSNTSKPAPAISPCTKHHTITFSSTIAPLPTLIRTHFLPNANMTSLLIMWQV